MGTVKSAVAGMIGFDVNAPLPTNKYVEFKEAGNSFAIRYIPRTPALIKGNLTAVEIESVISSGLALSLVQHVPLPGWQPSEELGKEYGEYAGTYCEQIGLPKGVNVWLDLEEVSSSATAQQVIDYCQAWYVAVLSHGFLPGLYVGWNVIISPEQLYSKLSYKNYWRAYNGGAVATRGFQLIQETEKTLNGITYDPNHVQIDAFGGLPIFLFP